VEQAVNNKVFTHLSALYELASGKDTDTGAELEAPGQEILQAEVSDMETILHVGVSSLSVRTVDTLIFP
jgi:hypothetical protein